jgi:hypothetical protein
VHLARGDEAARKMLATLAERCKETFIVATQAAYVPAITETMLASGFALVRERETVSPARPVRHLVFQRR